MLEFLVCGCGGDEEAFLVTADMLEFCLEAFVGYCEISQGCIHTQQSVYQ